MFKKIPRVFKQLFTKNRSRIIIDKIISRFHLINKKKKNIIDLENYMINISDFCISKDKSLWEEAKKFGIKLNKEGNTKLKDIKLPLGGGGAYELLYFITRLTKPNVIVETGVAAGFSSQAFLEAIDKNKKGKLFSSDFPYFKEENPEKYIGLLVDERYKINWDLFIEGDLNFIKVLSNKLKGKSIDLFHYDSDKSYRSRENTFQVIKKYLNKNCIIIFDDIQDNLHFNNLLLNYEKNNIKVFKFNGKYIGMIWNN